MDLKNKVCVFVDRGLFCHMAENLTRYFDRVIFHNPSWKSEFPNSFGLYMADGIPGVEISEDFWDTINELRYSHPGNFFVMFPDIIDSDLQLELVRQGIPVWGSRKGDELELNRWEFKQVLLKELGMPVQPMERVIGLPALRKMFEDPKNDGKFVKVSQTRGDLESRHHINYLLSKKWMDELQNKYGAFCDDMEFIVEDKIETDIEMGGDHYVVNGAISDPTIFGYEMKDVGYIGTFSSLAALPKPIQYVNEKLLPVLKAYGYANDWATEIRVGKDGKNYFIDPTCRSGSPPSQVLGEMVSNYGEIRWMGAHGILVNPVKVANYGVMAMIYCDDCDTHLTPYQIPDKIRQWVKFSFQTNIKNVPYTIPQKFPMGFMGSVVAVDDDPLEAIKKLVDYSKQIKGDDIQIKVSCIPEAIDEIWKARKMGYEFGDGKLPTVEQVQKVVR